MEINFLHQTSQTKRHGLRFRITDDDAITMDEGADEPMLSGSNCTFISSLMNAFKTTSNQRRK